LLAVEFQRKQAEVSLSKPAEELTTQEHQAIRALASLMHDLGVAQRHLGKSECKILQEEVLRLDSMTGDVNGQAGALYELGLIHQTIPSLRNRRRSEHYFQQSLELCSIHQGTLRSLNLCQLGQWAYERFVKYKRAGLFNATLLKRALQYYQEALSEMPVNVRDHLAIIHNQLGNVLGDAGDLANAMAHYRIAVREHEAVGDYFKAAQTRYGIAVTLVEANQLQNALEYARSAQRTYAKLGKFAEKDVKWTQGLIDLIRSRMED
jgi:tetratricopeptide (TPR) repeat protein